MNETIYRMALQKFHSKLATLAPLALVMTLIAPAAAHAYVDPGSGSVIVTTVLGFLAAIGYTFRKYLYRIKNLLLRNKAEDEETGKE